jgi:hypothetical protein
MKDFISRYSAFNHPKIYVEAAKRAEAAMDSSGGKNCGCSK